MRLCGADGGHVADFRRQYFPFPGRHNKGVPKASTNSLACSLASDRDTAALSDALGSSKPSCSSKRPARMGSPSHDGSCSRIAFWSLESPAGPPSEERLIISEPRVLLIVVVFSGDMVQPDLDQTADGLWATKSRKRLISHPSIKLRSRRIPVRQDYAGGFEGGTASALPRPLSINLRAASAREGKSGWSRRHASIASPKAGGNRSSNRAGFDSTIRQNTANT